MLLTSPTRPPFSNRHTAPWLPHHTLRLLIRLENSHLPQHPNVRKMGKAASARPPASSLSPQALSSEHLGEKSQVSVPPAVRGGLLGSRPLSHHSSRALPLSIILKHINQTSSHLKASQPTPVLSTIPHWSHLSLPRADSTRPRAHPHAGTPELRSGCDSGPYQVFRRDLGGCMSMCVHVLVFL